jgi:Flp pilus assembly protein TadD
MGRVCRIVVLVLAAATLGGCVSLEGARYYRSGSDALERGEVAMAVRDLEQAARLLPEASEVRNHLGIAYLEAGRSDEALREFEEAVALDCDNEAAVHNLHAVRDAPRSE